MLFKFAHMSDCHIGAWRDPQLRDLNIRAFEQAIDVCISEKVSFLVISGDLFDDNIPDLTSVQRACAKMRTARENGIAIYVIYGSHDYSANLVSMVDVLNSAGLFTKAVEYHSDPDGQLRLKFFTDPNTGAKIAGLSGRKTALETDYFAKLDREALRKERGFKILLFHSAITELEPEELVYEETVPLTAIPPDFNYYAGGHVHKKMEQDVKHLGRVGYPGPLFGADFKDLELTAAGESRGFFIITADETNVSTKFVETPVCKADYHVVEAVGKTAKQLNETLLDYANTADVNGKVVLLKVRGTLSAGRPADIDFSGIRQTLLNRGALVAQINRYALSPPETERISVRGEGKQEIEGKLFAEHLAKFKLDPTISDQSVKDLVNNRLVGNGGIRTAKKLLATLKTEQKENEGKTAYESRVLDEARRTIDLGGQE
jgi:hypothetical protein